jgi:hypothetical protein
MLSTMSFSAFHRWSSTPRRCSASASFAAAPVLRSVTSIPIASSRPMMSSSIFSDSI